MAILSSDFIARFSGRILNIHPSLLPDYKGLDTHASAIKDRKKWHGASVHLVTAALDDGPVIAQMRLQIRADDTPESLAARVLVLEHQLYPHVVNALGIGSLSLADGQPVWNGTESQPIENTDDSCQLITAKTQPC